MKTFHYYAPAPEEQRSFALQFLGTLLGLGVAAWLFFHSHDGGFRAVLIGAVLGLFWRLWGAAWQLEQKARRAQNAVIGVDKDALHLTDSAGKAQIVPWSEIQELAVKGGRLSVTWNGGSFAVGSREIEAGMTLVRLVMNKGQDEPPPRTKSNFIPLEPR